MTDSLIHEIEYIENYTDYGFRKLDMFQFTMKYMVNNLCYAS